MRTSFFAVAFCFAFGAACGDNLAVENDAGVDTPVSAGRTLTGNHIIRFELLDGSQLENKPVDLWNTVVEAQVPDEEGWRVVPGVGHRDGTFEIAGLPEGAVWLRVASRPFGDVFYWTRADHVDFDEEVLGPSDPPRADDNDVLHVAVDGLAPWQAGDALSWFVPDDVVFDTDLMQLEPPSDGATGIASDVDWSGRILAQVAAGDLAYVVQYRTQPLGAGIAVNAPIRAANPTIAQQPGTTGTITATLVDPPALPYYLAWARDQFEAASADVHPLAGASTGHFWGMSANPSHDGELFIAPEYPLAYLADGSIVEGTDALDLGALAIPNPYPREWITDSYVVTFSAPLPMPDGTPKSIDAAIGTRRTEFSTKARPATPAITPARSLSIGGGLTPTISWQPPAIGSATSYRLQIVKAVEQPPPPYRPGWYIDAELWVPGNVTQIRVPDDVLAEGTTYAIVMRAIAQPGQDIERRPFRTSAVAAFADAVSERFSPSAAR